MRDLVVHVVISTLLLALVDYFVDGIVIGGFGAALLGALLLAVFNLVASSLLHPQKAG
jgi:uncharacterized membrane protein YvlD (DUF360 family)